MENAWELQIMAERLGDHTKGARQDKQRVPTTGHFRYLEARTLWAGWQKYWILLGSVEAGALIHLLPMPSNYFPYMVLARCLGNPKNPFIEGSA